MIYDWLYFLGGLIIGSIGAFLVTKFYLESRRVFTKSEKEALDQQFNILDVENRINKDKYEGLLKEYDQLKKDVDLERNNVLELNKRLIASESDYRNLLEKLETQKQEVERLQEKFSIEFKNLANEILEEKSKKFTDQNKQSIGEILNPLKEKIVEFEKKVEQTNKENIERNTSLKEQIVSLKELNQKITKDAENLTRALKGESKTQGSWGEFILESILEKSVLGGWSDLYEPDKKSGNTNPQSRLAWKN